VTKGTIQNREAFLNKIAENLGRKPKLDDVKRPDWKHQPQWDVFKGYSQDELVEVLKAQCSNIFTDYVETNVADLSDVLQNVVTSYGGGPIITWDDPRFEEFGIKWQDEKQDLHVWNASLGEENIAKAEQANVGITFSDQTLAESGTVVLFSDKGKGRAVSLLPTTYIAIVPKSTIVPRITQAAHDIHNQVQNNEDIASCINFITGPSNSADIEMNLVVGVHGPVKATYIIVNDK
jgi:L-lactate dehydrogenase complex protein LldG